MSKLTQEKLKEVLYYDPKTGVFTWKVTFTTKNPSGSIAGGFSNGYIMIKVYGTNYLAHRLAWLYMKGFFPLGYEIDHEDRVRSNNRWSNLRLKSHQCNIRNTGNFSHNTTGVKGVHFVESTQKWISSIGIDRIPKYLGCYDEFHNAVCARLAGEQCLGWEGCDCNSPAFQYVQNMLKKKLTYFK